MINVYIGYDKNEDAAYQVCRRSLLAHASEEVNVVKLDQDWLRRIGLYRRHSYMEYGQCYDTIDRKPYSTEFSFSRFLVPSLQPEGVAVFCDSDFLWRGDIAEMANTFVHADKAAWCVQHRYVPTEGTKMRGQRQERYHRKNWTSLMIWNCDHPKTRALTPFLVNSMTGRWLHTLQHFEDEEIGAIHERWNWLEGHSSRSIEPKAVHYTRGTPDMPGLADAAYADEWRQVLSSTGLPASEAAD